MSVFAKIATSIKMNYNTASISFEFWADKELYIRTGSCGMDDYRIYLDKENKCFQLNTEILGGDLTAYEVDFIGFVLNLLQDNVYLILEEVKHWLDI